MAEEFEMYGPLSGEADRAVHATARLATALSSIKFPISRDELLASSGDIELAIVEGYPIRLRDLLANCEDESFESLEDLLTCRAVKESIRAA
jgi:hypothetical protein